MKTEQTISIEEQIAEAIRNGDALTGQGGVLTPMIHRAVEAVLEGELEAHLSSADIKDNRRNGHNRKQVKSGHGSFELKSPRDRSGTFEPEIIKKRQTVLTETLDQQLLALYGLGSSYADIKQHMQEMYGVEVSSATINAVTDKLIPTITEWRSRPLEAVYPILFMDGIYFKIREEGRVVSKVMYSLLGIDQSGKKDILGFCVG